MSNLFEADTSWEVLLPKPFEMKDEELRIYKQKKEKEKESEENTEKFLAQSVYRQSTLQYNCHAIIQLSTGSCESYHSVG